MGLYINQNSKGEILPAKRKAQALIDDGAHIAPPEWRLVNEIGAAHLVCVVQDGFHDAARYISSEDEFNFCNTEDGRQKTWLIYPHAKQLAK